MIKIMRRWSPAAFAMLCALAASLASAQTPPLIEVGETITGRAGTTELDLYMFLGTAGSTVTISLGSPTAALLTLYTPRGEEMLHATGQGNVTLEAVLPLTHAFLVGVSRADTSKSYTLRLNATQPDLHQMFFAANSGFPILWGNPKSVRARSCWLDPGRKLRETYGHGVQEVTLGRDGMEYAAVKGADGESRMRERKVEFEGTTAIYPIKTREGPMRYSRIDLEPVDLTELGPYEGYLCK